MLNQRALVGSFSFFDSEHGFSDTMFPQAIKGKVFLLGFIKCGR